MSRSRTSSESPSESELDKPDKGLILVVSGPSGTGKSTLCRRALGELDNLRFSISYTTRPPREGEVDGVDYFFVDTQTFLKMRDDNGFAEWAEVHGNFYGTSMEFITGETERGISLLLDIDTQGARQIKRSRQNSISIFFLPPSMDALRSRLEGRGTETQEQIERRLLHAHGEVRECTWYDYIIINDDFDVALTTFESVIRAERCRRTRLRRTLKRFL